MHIRLDGKTALVTGGSRGIGRGCALALAQAGARVVVNYRREREAAEEVVRLIEGAGGEAVPWQADIADERQVEAMLHGAAGRFGALDILVSNVAASTRQPFLQTDMAALRRTIDVSLLGNFLVCQGVARHLVERGAGGSIIVIGSLHGVYPLPQAFDYNLAKAAVHQMAMTMARELAPYRIRVNLLVPGWIDTPGERQWLPEAELMAKGAELPFGRLGTVDEVGAAAVFLASDAARYVSGSIYHVDGALSVTMPGGGSSQAREEGLG